MVRPLLAAALLLGLAGFSPVSAGTITTSGGLSISEPGSVSGFLEGLSALVPGALLTGVTMEITGGTELNVTASNFGDEDDEVRVSVIGTLYIAGDPVFTSGGSCSIFLGPGESDSCGDGDGGTWEIVPTAGDFSAAKVPMSLQFRFDRSGGTSMGVNIFASTFADVQVEYTYDVAAIPEPGTLGLVALGILAGGFWIRRRAA